MVKKVEVFKDGQDAGVRNNAGHQQPLSFFARCVFEPDARPIINDDGEKQNEQIRRAKHHVEKTTAAQQQQPSPTLRQQEIGQRGDDEKQNKLKRIKQH